MTIGPEPFLVLPDELIHNILASLDSNTLLACQATSQRLNQLGNHPLLWRSLCQREYRAWHPRHHFQEILQKPVSTTDWRRLHLSRRSQNAAIVKDLDGILSSSQSRIPRVARILEHGPDAIDALLHQGEVSDFFDDGLARKFYSKEIIGSVNRKIALQTWFRLLNGEDVPLEVAFGAFDLCLVEYPPLNLEEISTTLDAIASRIQEEDTKWQDAKTTRTKALALAAFLRNHNLLGVRSQATKHEIQNSLLGVALCEADHPSLPLISSIIYCSVARRLGIDAHPCNLPGHILTMVRPPPGQTLDNIAIDPTSTSESDQILFHDPHGLPEAVHPDRVRNVLINIDIPTHMHAAYLRPASTLELVRRSVRNLNGAIQYVQEGVLTNQMILVDPDKDFYRNPHHPIQPTRIPLERAIYTTRWLNVLLGEEFPPGMQMLRVWAQSQLSHLMDSFQEGYRLFDTALITDLIAPRYRNTDEGVAIRNILTEIAAADEAPCTPHPRTTITTTTTTTTTPDTSRVVYKVGQVILHRRYNYYGIIMGWSPHCDMDEVWMKQMRVHSLPGGRHQPFYNVVDEIGTIRHVAAENIEIVREGIESRTGLRLVGGRWFKRLDPERGVFVSNIRDAYPDD